MGGDQREVAEDWVESIELVDDDRAWIVVRKDNGDRVVVQVRRRALIEPPEPTDSLKVVVLDEDVTSRERNPA